MQSSSSIATPDVASQDQSPSSPRSILPYLQNAWLTAINQSQADRSATKPTDSRDPDFIDKGILRCGGKKLTVHMDEEVGARLICYMREKVTDAPVTNYLECIALASRLNFESNGVKCNGEDVLQKMFIVGQSHALNLTFAATNEDGRNRYYKGPGNLISKGYFIAPGTNNHLLEAERNLFLPILMADDSVHCIDCRTNVGAEKKFLSDFKRLNDSNDPTYTYANFVNDYPLKPILEGSPPKFEVKPRTAVPDLIYIFDKVPLKKGDPVADTMLLMEIKLPSVLSVNHFLNLQQEYFHKLNNDMDIHLVWKRTTVKTKLEQSLKADQGYNNEVEGDLVDQDQEGLLKDGSVTPKDTFIIDGKECWKEPDNKGEMQVYYHKEVWSLITTSYLMKLWEHVMVQVNTSLITEKSRYGIITTGEYAVLIEYMDVNKMTISEPIQLIPSKLCPIKKGRGIKKIDVAQDDAKVISLTEVMSALALWSLDDEMVPRSDYPGPRLPNRTEAAPPPQAVAGPSTVKGKGKGKERSKANRPFIEDLTNRLAQAGPSATPSQGNESGRTSNTDFQEEGSPSTKRRKID
ncbi:uncharacterized protein L201_006062 [Kwoniella dendrophila CBS 6074]|uniref:Uncharacterized protein n=1 Tax=Kwoniella dendrophila CBS 6074 TaxID=1295534 RepID=A0AAX4K055_9TREE